MIFKQRNIGTFFGTVKLIISSVTPYAGWISLALVGIMSFYTTIYPLFSSWGIEMQFWVFVIVITLIVVIIAIIEWVFLLPSYYEANNIQVWEHGSPFRTKLEDLEKDLAKIKGKLGIDD